MNLTLGPASDGLEWLPAIVAVVQAITIPLLIGILAVMFREPITGLINRIVEADAFGARGKFAAADTTTALAAATRAELHVTGPTDGSPAVGDQGAGGQPLAAEATNDSSNAGKRRKLSPWDPGAEVDDAERNRMSMLLYLGGEYDAVQALLPFSPASVFLFLAKRLKNALNVFSLLTATGSADAEEILERALIRDLLSPTSAELIRQLLDYPAEFTGRESLRVSTAMAEQRFENYTAAIQALRHGAEIFSSRIKKP